MTTETPVRRSHVEADRPLARRIGIRIRAARTAAGMTQQQLAAPRYTKAYVSALENGLVKPSMAALHFLAGRLGVPAIALITDDVSDLRTALIQRLDGHGTGCVLRCIQSECQHDHWCGQCAVVHEATADIPLDPTPWQRTQDNIEADLRELAGLPPREH